MPFSGRPVNGPPYPPPTPAPLNRNHPSSSPSNADQADSSTPHQITNSGECLDHGILFLPSSPSSEGWSNLVASVKSGFALTGSAVAGQIGPVLGLMDVWESYDSYLFRISLPGVARDERSFSCEIEIDGTVLIKGVTVTGGRRVEKYSQSFEMCSQNLCPSGPGPFSISFKLPGPVDPKHLQGNFGTDGIFEGIAFKAMV